MIIDNEINKTLTEINYKISTRQANIEDKNHLLVFTQFNTNTVQYYSKHIHKITVIYKNTFFFKRD